MQRPIGSRWLLLALPLLVGGLLAMHGLAGGSSPEAGREVSVASDGAAGSHHQGQCTHCQLGHVMVVCMAVLVAAGTLGGARRVSGPPASAARPTQALSWARRWTERLPPPEPAWVRLAVMQH